MTVKDANGGDVVFYSHNGGDWQAVKDECRRLGLLPERQRRPNGEVWRETGRYEYVDADGTVAYRTVRLEKAGERKRFTAQRPDGRGGWVNKLDPNAPRILYRLPDIIAADRASVVYLTEGERKADKLAGWGFVATAIAFGAKGWRDTYAKALADRTVIILPDNDDEGRAFADHASKSINQAGGKAFVLPLPDLPPKGDIIDWAGTPEELRSLADAILHPPVPMLPMLDPGAWQDQPAPARTWALHEWIPTRQATYLTGAGSAGKSLLSQQLATCVALGRSFLGVETRQSVAIYLTCEDDADELHRRQLAICAALNVSARELSGKLHLITLAGGIGNELATFDPQGRMATTEAWATLHATVMQTGAGFVALDNVAHLFAGNENIRNQVAAFCGLLNGLAADADASILFLGHPNKAGDSFSGSTAWENQVRSRLFLDQPRDSNGEALDPDARQLARAKANYARNGETIAFRWHQWAFVNEAELPPRIHAEMAANAQAGADNTIFLACLDERNRQGRAVSESKASRTYAPKEFVAMAESKGIGRGRLEAAMDRLFRTRAIERGVVGRHQGEGKDMIGLRRVPDDLPDDVPMAPSDDVPMTPRSRPKAHTPYLTDKGAGWPPAAPLVEDDLDWGDGL
ncbi:AAA family ATPase [Sphingomonas floccifaciens]